MTSMTATAPVLSAEPGPRRRSWLAQLGIDTAYLLPGLVLATVAFMVMVAGFSLGVSLLVVFLIGIPILVGTLYAARGFAELERSRIAPVLRRPRSGVRYRRAAPDARALSRLFTPLGEPQYWLDALYGLVRFPISVATWCVTVTWWSMALGGLTYGLWDWTLPKDINPEPGLIVVNDRSLPDVLGIENTTANRILVYFGLGLIFALTLPAVVRICALAEAWTAHGLLNGVAGLRDQVADLARDRDSAHARTAAAVSAEATALRRLERDIHDGPQQRLVRLAMDLGRARQQLEGDPQAAARTVEEALVQTREALDELRTLSRGIAPPVLTDRGLAAAVAALAARATIPVDIDIPDVRLPDLAEQTAYFTIAEALANAAKHSGANRVSVAASLQPDRIVVTVTDDGQGGAHIAKGHGLAGLADRLQAAGGVLWVSSPHGGPTSVRAELPLSGSPASGAPQ